MSVTIRWILRHRKAVLVITVLLTLLFLVPLAGLRNDNSIEVWLDKDGDDYITYKKFVEEFHVQDFIIAAVEGLNYKEKASRRLFNALSGKLRKIDGVHSVHHLNDFSVFFTVPQDKFIDLFVSKDKNIYTFWIKPESGHSGSLKKMIDTINDVLSSNLPRSAAYHLAGPPVLNNALDEASNNQSGIFFPMVILMSGVILLILFRDFKVLFVCFTVAAVTQIWSLAVISISGNTMNMVMTALPPLLWVLSLSALIYMVHSLRVEQDIERAVLKVFKPCSLTAVTTAAGFLSLTLSRVGPVREMGIFTFTGMFISLLLSFTLAPVLLEGTGKDNLKGGGIAGSGASALANGIAQYKSHVLVFAAAVMAVCFFYVPRINMDTNNLNFFESGSKVYRDYMFIGKKLTGHSPLEVVFELPDGLLFEEAVDISNTLKKELIHLDGVKKALTPTTFYGLLDSGSDRYVNEDATKIRLSVLTDYISTNDTQDLISRIRRMIDQTPGAQTPPMKYSITGVVQLLVQMQDELLGTQMKSFSLALIFIAVIFYMLFKSVPLAIIAMVPNIFPIAVNLGLMGLLDIPLNVATIMIASVAIGIAVDDSIHFIIRYREYYRNSTDARVSIENTLNDVGRPVVFTTLINTIGFGVLMFSDFMPIKYFGVLMVLTLLSALLADLALLPALLLGGSKWMNG